MLDRIPLAATAIFAARKRHLRIGTFFLTDARHRGRPSRAFLPTRSPHMPDWLARILPYPDAPEPSPVRQPADSQTASATARGTILATCERGTFSLSRRLSAICRDAGAASVVTTMTVQRHATASRRSPRIAIFSIARRLAIVPVSAHSACKKRSLRPQAVGQRFDRQQGGNRQIVLGHSPSCELREFLRPFLRPACVALRAPGHGPDYAGPVHHPPASVHHRRLLSLTARYATPRAGSPLARARAARPVAAYDGDPIPAEKPVRISAARLAVSASPIWNTAEPDFALECLETQEPSRPGKWDDELVQQQDVVEVAALIDDA